MGFFKNIFGRADKPIKDYNDFWIWFQANQQTFYKVVKSGENPEKGFFNKHILNFKN